MYDVRRAKYEYKLQKIYLQKKNRRTISLFVFDLPTMCYKSRARVNCEHWNSYANPGLCICFVVPMFCVELQLNYRMAEKKLKIKK